MSKKEKTKDRSDPQEDSPTILDELELTYLSEEPAVFKLDKTDSDSEPVGFAHDKVAESVAGILLSVPSPYCVGLSGAWGSGKTGIARSVEGLIRQKSITAPDPKSRDVKVHYFDILEHADDVFRRQLLISMDNTLCRGENKFEKILYQSSTYKETPIESKRPTLKYCKRHGWRQFGRAWRKFARDWLRCQTWGKFALVLVLALILLIGLWKVAANITPIQTLIGATVTIAIAVLSLSPHLVKSITVVRNDEAPRSPEQLDSKFDQLLNSLEEKEPTEKAPSSTKLILILDNLDRCSPKAVANVLSALTTFVKRPGVVALVPCDVRRVTKAMKTEQDGDDYAPEFLRKAFNTVIHIPELSKLDIRSFGLARLKQSTFTALAKEDSQIRDRLLHVMTLGDYENPRRIKAFINNMTSRLSIVRSLEGVRTALSSHRPRGLVSALAWVQVIEDRWPGVFYHLKKDPDMLFGLLQKENADELGALFPDECGNLGDEAKRTALKAFVDNTRAWARPEDILPVIDLRCESTHPVAGERLFVQFLKTADTGQWERIPSEEFRTGFDSYMELINRSFQELQLPQPFIEGILTAVRALLHVLDAVPPDRLRELADLTAGQFAASDSAEKIAEIEDPRLVAFLSTSASDECRPKALALLGALATRYLNVSPVEDQWLQAFITNAKRIGAAAQNCLRQVLIRHMKAFTGGADAAQDKKAVDELARIIGLCKEHDALGSVIDESTIQLHRGMLKAEASDIMDSQIDIHLEMTEILPQEKRYASVLGVLTAIAKEAASTPGAFQGKPAWTAKQLSKLTKEPTEDDAEKMRQCCDDLLTATRTSDPAAIGKLLDICVPIYRYLSDNGQKWVSDEIVTAVREKKLSPIAPVEKALESREASSLDDACVELATEIMRVYSGTDLTEENLNTLHGGLQAIADACFAGHFSEVEARLWTSWLKQDAPTAWTNVRQVIEKQQTDKSDYAPDDRFMDALPGVLRQKELSVQLFSDIWRHFRAWRPEALGMLWDATLQVCKGDNRAIQGFVLEELREEGLRKAILSDERRQENLARAIIDSLNQDVSLLDKESPLLSILTEMVLPVHVAKAPHFQQTLELALDDASSMEGAAILATHVADCLDTQNSTRLLEKVGERGAITAKDSDVFSTLKDCANMYAERTGEGLPECFRDPSVTPDETGQDQADDRPATA